MSGGSLDNYRGVGGERSSRSDGVGFRGCRAAVPTTTEGACIGALERQHLAAMALTERDLAIIEFERTWWSEDSSKETIIRERFELSTTRYYELLGDLIESAEAYAHDPLVIRRLRRLRDRRRKARFERQIEQPPAR